MKTPRRLLPRAFVLETAGTRLASSTRLWSVRRCQRVRGVVEPRRDAAGYHHGLEELSSRCTAPVSHSVTGRRMRQQIVLGRGRLWGESLKEGGKGKAAEENRRKKEAARKANDGALESNLTVLAEKAA